MTNSQFVRLPFSSLVLSLTIFEVHAQALEPNGQYRREDSSHLYGMPEDRPWFCWFNQTLLEFFIYIDKDVNSSATTTTTSSSLSPSTSPSTFTTSSSTTSSTFIPPVTVFTAKASGSPYGPEFTKYYSAGSGYNRRRSKGDHNPRNYYEYYPRLMKIEEKRKPSGNIPPYCQQMQVLDNNQLAPVPFVEQISIEELEDMDAPTRNRFRRRGDPEDLSQDCACEWISG